MSSMRHHVLLPSFALVVAALPAFVAVACGGSSADIPPGSSPDASTVDAPTSDGSPLDSGPDAPRDDASADGGGDGASGSCTFGNTGECKADEYCDAPTCGKGTCAKIPAEKDNLDPVCGCDEITYWNGTVAANAGVAAKAAGRCGASAKGCGGIAGQKCPKGSFCGYELDNGGQCAILDPRGKCWGVPSKCPAILIGPVTRGCGEVKCEGACELIKAEKPFYKDNTCPM